jgi:hypothetical protein
MVAPDSRSGSWNAGWIELIFDATGLAWLRVAMITAIYPDARRKVHMIKKTVRVCPIFGGEFSPGGEFSVHITAKSPSGENSPRSWSRPAPSCRAAVDPIHVEVDARPGPWVRSAIAPRVHDRPRDSVIIE